MKAVYTILFFAITLLQIVLFFLLLKSKDGGSFALLMASIAGIVACIALQVYCVHKHLHRSAPHNQ